MTSHVGGLWRAILTIYLTPAPHLCASILSVRIWLVLIPTYPNVRTMRTQRGQGSLIWTKVRFKDH